MTVWCFGVRVINFLVVTWSNNEDLGLMLSHKYRCLHKQVVADLFCHYNCQKLVGGKEGHDRRAFINRVC
jgi:hypothetical protein